LWQSIFLMRNLFLLSVLVFLGSCAASRTTKTVATGSKQEQQVETKSVIVEPGHIVNEERDYTINSFSMEGDILNINITYRGGCGQHSFELYSNGFLKKSLPPQVDVFLEHKKENALAAGRQEPCSKEIKQTLKFNISALKKPNYNLIVVNINSADNKVEWKLQ
jgi:hypothetical protein